MDSIRQQWYYFNPDLTAHSDQVQQQYVKLLILASHLGHHYGKPQLLHFVLV